jgi:hypothetical protein
MIRMIVDTSNLFWRSVSASQRYGVPVEGEDAAGMGLHLSLMSLKKHWNKIRPDSLAISFEGSRNWRKAYTQSEECYSKRLYKGNRVLDPSMAVLFDVIKAFEDLAINHTAITVLSNPLLEGDDLISGYALHYAALGDEVVILSGDKDFASLISDKITLINPDDGKPRSLVDLCGVDDAEYFMFQKCFRGDAGDNVLPAYPRVRATKLQKAFGVNGAPRDEFLLNSLMNHEWEYTDPENPSETRKMNVGKLFEENKLLMDLRAQPEHIRQAITDTILAAEENRGKFNYFKFCQFLGAHNLVQIGEKSMDFVPMFSGKSLGRLPNQKTDLSVYGFEV